MLVKLEIIGIDDFNYILKSDKGTYSLLIEFHGNIVPNIGDYLYVTDKILGKRCLYAYGPLDGIYGKKKDINEDELMKIVTGGNEYYLQRYYG